MRTFINLALIVLVISSLNAQALARGPFDIVKSPFELFKKDKDEKEDEKAQGKAEEAEQQVRPKVIFDPKSPLGAVYAENAINKAEFYIEEGDLASAGEVLRPVSDWVYKATEYHTDLFKSLKKVQNSEVQADLERELAIKFAVLRDRALFIESKLLSAEGKNKEAVKNLVEVVRSQPSTDLGFKAYKSLQELGFSYKVEYEVAGDEIIKDEE